MGIKLYVGNLSNEMDQKRLEKMFAEFGTVDTATLFNAKSGIFAHIEMACNEAALTAMEMLNGSQQSGRPINVTEVCTLNIDQDLNEGTRRWLS